MSEPIITALDASSCPASDEALNDYLDLEDVDWHRPSLRPLFQSASLEKLYWVWAYRDSSEEEMYAVVCQSQPPERPDAYEIGCGPALQMPNASPQAILAMLSQAGF